MTRKDQMGAAMSLMHVERLRQITAEGYDEDHDDEHMGQELAYAAACYAAGQNVDAEGADGFKESLWPWEGSVDDAVEGKSRIRQLVIAGALILAEIERRLRAGEKP